MHPPDDDGVVFVEDANEGLSESKAIAQTATLSSLVKGKTTLNKMKRARFVDTPDEVDCWNERGSNPREVLEVSEARKLGQMFTPTFTPSLALPLLLRHRFQHATPPRSVPVHTMRNS